MKKIISILCAGVAVSATAYTLNTPSKDDGKILVSTEQPGAIVNLRISPDKESTVVTKVHGGDTLDYTGHREKGWLRVHTDKGIAYISEDYAQVLKAADWQPERIPSRENLTRSADEVAPAEVETVYTTETAEEAVDPKDKVPAKFPVQMKKVTRGKKTYNVADINDEAKVYRENAVKANCFFVISKQEFRLYVYEKVDNDILLAAHYPVCYAKNAGPKTKSGDMSTPECSYEKPAVISQISSASSWKHDFKDGRGSVPSYGAWFMRLNLSNSDCHAGCRSNRSIGIHGSTSNEPSVPGRDSEGCIRLRDNDIKDLKNRFAQVGTRVTIKGASEGKLDFEKKAEKACKGYQCAYQGYVMPK